MGTQTALQGILRDKLENLRIRYPRYSLRAYAKKIGLSPATLSLILQGKRQVSQKLALRLSEKLLLDPQERSEVLKNFLDRRSQELSEKAGPGYLRMSLDQHQVISDWRAFGILNLIKTKNFRSDAAWVAKRLGLSLGEVQQTVEILKRIGLLRVKNGKWTRGASRYRSSDDSSDTVLSSAVQKSHSQTLDLAQRALEQTSVPMRDFTSLTFAFDVKKMSRVKAMIRKFQDDLLAEIEDEADPKEVYRLALQFFPLSVLGEKGEGK